MCGIAGIIGADRQRVGRVLEAMVRCQTHRGPDDQGLELIDVGGLTVGLGQRRLSIIDLSPAGHQPMVNRETGDTIIYNGELYNYMDLRRPYEQRGVKFRGHSDTEAILYGIGHEGPQFLEKTCGMYAIAYFDSAKRRVLLARDPMGIKPLYVASADGCLMWASEVRAILASGLVPTEVDSRGLAGLLAYGCVPEPLTFFKGIQAFAPGCWQWIDLDPAAGKWRAGSVCRHWSFPEVDESITEKDAVERVRSTLNLAVKEHLIADVPVGVFLSSGIDSTVIANLANRHTERLRTFTIGFSDQDDLNESSLAEQTARKLGVEHRDIQITGPEAQGWAQNWLESLDQPSVDGLNTYVISKAVRQEGIVVALSGLGGDELFCGYNNFDELPRIKRGYDLISWLPSLARRALFSARSIMQPASVRERVAEMGASDGDLLSLYLYRRRTKSDQRMRAMGLDWRTLGLSPTYMPEEALREARESGPDVVAAISRLESRFYMRNMLLRDSDTNAMAHSLEIRVPMLDTRVMNLAYAIPGRVRMPQDRADKHLLRTAFDDMLHGELRIQRKRGFVLPIRRWMTSTMRDMCEAALENVKKVEILNSGHIDEVWQEFLGDPDKPMWGSAFMLCVLGRYLKTAEGWGRTGVRNGAEGTSGLGSRLTFSKPGPRTLAATGHHD